MTREIYLDMDGVCTDFNKAAIEAHGHNAQEVLARWAADHRGEFYTYEVLKMQKGPFFDHLHTLGETFWIELESYPWFERLYEGLSEIGQVMFCTAPTDSPTCVAGKVRWLQDRFGTEFDEYILTYHKDRLAHANAFLVDDSDRNVALFSARGGNAVLFPQFWNSNHQLNCDPVEFVLSSITSN